MAGWSSPLTVSGPARTSTPASTKSHKAFRPCAGISSQSPSHLSYVTCRSSWSFKRAFSAPVPQVAFGTRRTALRRRREPADSFYFTISRSFSSLAPRLRAHSTHHAPWPACHSIWPVGVTHFFVVRGFPLSSVCPPQFAVRFVLTRRGRAPRQGPRAAARRPGVPVASSRTACLQKPRAGRPQNDPSRIAWRSAVSLASFTSTAV